MKTFIKENMFIILITILLLCYFIINCICFIKVNCIINEYDFQNIEKNIEKAIDKIEKK